MKTKPRQLHVISWAFFILVFGIGVMNLLWVHPVPGMIYFFFSVIYVPPVNTFIKNKFGFFISPVLKIILGIAILWFTLGVSDLADMINRL